MRAPRSRQDSNQVLDLALASRSFFSRSTRARVSGRLQFGREVLQEAVDGAARRMVGHVPHLGGEAHQFLVDPLPDLPVHEARRQPGAPPCTASITESPCSISQSWAPHDNQVHHPPVPAVRHDPLSIFPARRDLLRIRAPRDGLATTACTSESAARSVPTRSAAAACSVTRSAVIRVLQPPPEAQPDADGKQPGAYDMARTGSCPDEVAQRRPSTSSWSE